MYALEPKNRNHRGWKTTLPVSVVARGTLCLRLRAKVPQFSVAKSLMTWGWPLLFALMSIAGWKCLSSGCSLASIMILQFLTLYPMKLRCLSLVKSLSFWCTRVENRVVVIVLSLPMKPRFALKQFALCVELPVTATGPPLAFSVQGSTLMPW